jgi:uncharacterized protein YciI
MSTERAPDGLPENVGIEQIWVVEATYAPDAAELRQPFRAEHLTHLADLIASGTVIEAGAFVDVSASVLLVRAATEDEAVAMCRDDVYFRNGVWVSIRARPFGRVFPRAY